MKSFYVLALDGGGAKGIYTVGILKELEMFLNKKIYESFDLIYGTSTGAIIGCLISLGHDIDYIENQYSKLIPKIMCKSSRRKRSKALKEYLESILKNYKMDECKLPIGVVSTNFDNNKPVVFKNHKTQVYSGKYSFTKGFGLELKDIILSSCSAYPFFNPVQLEINKSQQTFIDGGYCFNNPSIMSLADARKLKKRDQKIKLLSLGTGNFIEKKTISQWLIDKLFITKLFTNTILQVNANATEDLINHMNFDIDYLRINKTNNEIKTNLLEKNLKVLNKIKNEGKKSFLEYEKKLEIFFEL